MQKVGAYTDRVTDAKEWRPGNPATGQTATPMLAAYFNMVQRELVGAVEGSQIALDGSDDGQLLKAIKKQAEAVAPVATQAEALVTDEATSNNTKRMTPLRVLQAIKAQMLSATETVVGMLRVGTQAEVNAGALDTVAVTPKKLRLGFVVSIGASSGYVIFPTWLGGLTYQWGTLTFTVSAGSGSIALPLPVAFSTNLFSANVTTAARLNSTSIGIDLAGSSVSQLMLYQVTGSGSGAVAVFYNAWGK